ncbi:hypothetical protein CHS0354_007023 [Potamilus streckersoni]|uniref:Uncharacterized protein n=1 Tax=Potamilus streckersoni TaxID=2493646 RepID=A0AAE0RWR1_9BIVA|nr:hypothetical protein CHS0354_007023 [Potamilus streckersoni]
MSSDKSHKPTRSSAQKCRFNSSNIETFNSKIKADASTADISDTKSLNLVVYERNVLVRILLLEYLDFFCGDVHYKIRVILVNQNQCYLNRQLDLPEQNELLEQG